MWGKKKITIQEAIDTIVHSFHCHTGGQHCGIVDRFKKFIQEQEARIDWENNGKFHVDEDGHPPTLKSSPFFGKYLCDFYIESRFETMSIRIDDPCLPLVTCKLIAFVAIAEWMEQALILGVNTEAGKKAQQNALSWRKWYEGHMPKGTVLNLSPHAVWPTSENVALATIHAYGTVIALPDLPPQEIPNTPG